MNLSNLYNKLCDHVFQNTEEGDLFYNYYIVPYDAEEEYNLRRQLQDFKERLIRPTNYIDVLKLDLYEEFCHYLDAMSFGKKNPSYLKYLLAKGPEAQDGVLATLSNKASGKDFCKYIHDRITAYCSDKEKNTPYIFIYGIGQMYPYLRTNVFLTNYEGFNESNKYKIIVFYPGNAVENSFSLFGKLNDDHTYRALLINE